MIPVDESEDTDGGDDGCERCCEGQDGFPESPAGGGCRQVLLGGGGGEAALFAQCCDRRHLVGVDEIKRRHRVGGSELIEGFVTVGHVGPSIRVDPEVRRVLAGRLRPSCFASRCEAR